MVFILVLSTVVLFLAVDFFLRKEERAIKAAEKSKKSPIFLSPEKALLPLENELDRIYHISHTWALPSDQGFIYVGFDNFISSLFTAQIKISELPQAGSKLTQGTKIWDVNLGDKKVAQLSPVSGEVVEVNPACKMNMPLPADDVEKSWILKIKADDLKKDSNNLMQHMQANVLNMALRDELYLFAQKGHYLNDGGEIIPEFIARMSKDEWTNVKKKFFPYDSDI